MKTIRVLFHVRGLTAGGAERQLALLVREIALRGVEPHVVTFTSGGQYWDELQAWGGCPLTSLDRRGRLDFSVVAQLARYARAHRIDVLQGWMPLCNSVAALAARMIGRPALMGVRSSALPAAGLGTWLYIRLDGLLGRRLAWAIVCNSERGLQDHRELGYPAKKMIFIPNAVQRPAAMPAPLGGQPPWRLGVLARLDPVKDHPTLFRALRLLLDAGQPVRLDVFGDGPAAYRRRLELLAGELGVAAAIRWSGHVPDPWPALAELDVVVSSSNTEGMSNALVEAMAAGRAIVATDAGDARALLQDRHGRCGLVVPPADPAALAAGIGQLLADPAAAAAAGTRAREAVADAYGVPAMVERYRALYEAAAAGHAPPS